MMAFAVMFIAAMGMNAQTVERLLYADDFTAWAGGQTTVTKETRFEHQALTLTLSGDATVAPAQTQASVVGYVEILAGKNGELTTTPIAEVSEVEFVSHVGRGGGNGWKLMVKGDGDADWVTLSEETVKSPTAITVKVNRKNVQLKWANINTSKVIYLGSVSIKGDIAAEKVPVLKSFKVNGTVVDASVMFEEQSDYSMAGAFDISKSLQMIGTTNPLSDLDITAGSLTGIEYNGDATQCVAKATVSNGTDEVVYVFNATQKPDYTVTLVDLKTGETIETKTIEKDSQLGTFKMDITVPTSYIAVGPLESVKYQTSEGQPFYSYRKIASDYVVVSDMTLYLDIRPNDSACERVEYVFSDPINNQLNPYFYPEDHDGFKILSGSAEYANAQHGWLFKAGTQIVLTTGSSALLNLNLCTSTPADATIDIIPFAMNSVSVNARPGAPFDGAGLAFLVPECREVAVNFNNDVYVHGITITKNLDKKFTLLDEEHLQIAKDDVDALLAAIEIANSDGRMTIFVPNGRYDLGERVLTTIYHDDISIVGESMEGTVIVNAPNVLREGINLTATLRNYGKNLYLQDLTLQNAMEYYATPTGAGRGVVILDQGDKTICKNVAMLSYQDTYYTKNNAAKLYWETSEIHGTVDFICGGGDVMFKDTKIVVEPRQKNGTGACTITAPTTNTKWGYVFDGCTIDNKAASYNLGRSWQNTPKCVYLNSKMSAVPNPRWTAAGMNGIDPAVFAEYNSTDLNGNDVTPAQGTTMKFTNKNTTLSIVLTPEEAAQYTVANMFGEWAPDAIAAQEEMTEEEYNAPDASAFYLADGVVVKGSIPAGAKTVRKANSRGGFGAPYSNPDGIISVGVDAVNTASSATYNTLGQRVDANVRGLVIRNGVKYIVK